MILYKSLIPESIINGADKARSFKNLIKSGWTWSVSSLCTSFYTPMTYWLLHPNEFPTVPKVYRIKISETDLTYGFLSSEKFSLTANLHIVFIYSFYPAFVSSSAIPEGKKMTRGLSNSLNLLFANLSTVWLFSRCRSKRLPEVQYKK
jgi:hypothetical protein